MLYYMYYIILYYIARTQNPLIFLDDRETSRVPSVAAVPRHPRLDSAEFVDQFRSGRVSGVSRRRLLRRVRQRETFEVKRKTRTLQLGGYTRG